jgi:hypothetical protein
MTSTFRLTNDCFIALRSLQLEDYILGADILWKHNRKWVRISADGWATSRDDGSCRYPGVEVFDRAEKAIHQLAVLGLACEQVIRCCPGQACHLNDRLAWRLTAEGERFADRLREAARKKAQAIAVAQPGTAGPAPAAVQVVRARMAQLARTLWRTWMPGARA